MHVIYLFIKKVRAYCYSSFFLIKSTAGNRDCIVMKLINSDTFGWQHFWEIFFGKKVIFVGGDFDVAFVDVDNCN